MGSAITQQWLRTAVKTFSTVYSASRKAGTKGRGGGPERGPAAAGRPGWKAKRRLWKKEVGTLQLHPPLQVLASSTRKREGKVAPGNINARNILRPPIKARQLPKQNKQDRGKAGKPPHVQSEQARHQDVRPNRCGAGYTPNRAPVKHKAKPCRPDQAQTAPRSTDSLHMGLSDLGSLGTQSKEAGKQSTTAEPAAPAGGGTHQTHA